MGVIGEKYNPAVLCLLMAPNHLAWRAFYIADFVLFNKSLAFCSLSMTLPHCELLKNGFVRE